LEENNILDKEKIRKILDKFKDRIKQLKNKMTLLENELFEEKEKSNNLEKKIVFMDEEIIRQANIIERLKKERKKLLGLIESFKENIDNIAEKKEFFKENIDEVLKISNMSQDKMEELISSSNINDVEIEMRVFLKGMFHRFIKENNSLEILIEGNKYYYPLSSYQCTHLPISGSRVLIFKSEDNKNIIFGFNGPRLIDIAKKLKAEIKFASETQNRLKLFIEEEGYINFTPEKDFWENNNYKMGDNIILTEINIECDRYFYISNKNNLKTDRLKVLEFLRKEN